MPADERPIDDPPGAPPPPVADVDPARAALARARSAARERRVSAPPPARSGSRSPERSGERGRPGRPVGADEPRRSGARPDERDPKTLSGAIDALVTSRGWEAEAAVGGLVGRWPEIMGPDIAAHVSVESFEAATGLVLLRADSTAWATQMRLLLPTVMRRLREEIGWSVVREVSVLGPAAPSWRKGPRTVPGRGPRDTYG